MVYAIKKFGSVDIPQYSPVHFLGTGRIGNVVFTPLLAGGMHDSLGGDQGTVQGVTIAVRASVNRVDQSAAQLETQLKALRALVGKRDKLYRLWEATDTWNWVYARMMSMNAVRDEENVNALDVDLEFIQTSPVWNGARHGGGWTFDSGEYFDTGLVFDEAVGDVFTLDTSPKTLNVYNHGNAPVRNCKITITAGAANITALEITKSGETEIDYIGTIVAGQSLVIDCGAFTVKNNGADDYNNFSLGAGHVISDWVLLDPDGVVNALVFTITGGSTNSAVLFEYYNGHF